MNIKKYSKISVDGESVLLYIQDIQQSTGRRKIPHEYPNQDGAYWEDMGALPVIYNVNAYISDIDSLIIATRLTNLYQLCKNAEKAGVFRHPDFGDVDVVIKEVNIQNNSQADVSGSVFNLTLCEQKEEVLPLETYNAGGMLAFLRNTFNDIKRSEFVGNVKKGINAINDTIAVAEEANNFFGEAIGYASGITDGLSALKNQLSRFNANIANLIQTPDKLFNNLKAIGDGFLLFTEDYKNGFEINASCFSRDPTFLKNGAEVMQKKEPLNIINNEAKVNQRLIDSYYQIVFFFNMCQTSVLVDYRTQDEIRKYINLIQQAFSILSQDGVDNDLLDIVMQTYTATNEHLTTQSLLLPTVRQVEVKNLDIYTISFRYYGNITRVDEIVKMNNIIDVSSISGVINLLSF